MYYTHYSDDLASEWIVTTEQIIRITQKLSSNQSSVQLLAKDVYVIAKIHDETGTVTKPRLLIILNG